MVSSEQEREINRKILAVHKAFYSSNTILEVSKKTGIPTSSVQRYLTCERAESLLGKDAVLEAKRRLSEIKKEGNQKGGINYSIFNVSTKNSAGQFTGSKKR